MKVFLIGLPIILFSVSAHAWGDEEWGEPAVYVTVATEPDYLQQRIEARRARHQTQQAELARITKTMRRNDRPILKKSIERTYRDNY